MKFFDFVCLDATLTELNGKNRDEVIEELVLAIDKTGNLEENSAKKIVNAVIKRENEASTGLGKGVAIPHVKHHAVKKTIAAVGKSSRGVDFASLDKLPVYSVVLLLSPSDDPDKHLLAMEAVFKNLQNDKFRSFLKQAQSTKAIEELLRDADENKI